MVQVAPSRLVALLSLAGISVPIGIGVLLARVRDLRAVVEGFVDSFVVGVLVLV